MTTDNFGIQHKTYEDYLKGSGASGDRSYEASRDGRFYKASEMTEEDISKIYKLEYD